MVSALGLAGKASQQDKKKQHRNPQAGPAKEKKKQIDKKNEVWKAARKRIPRLLPSIQPPRQSDCRFALRRRTSEGCMFPLFRVLLHFIRVPYSRVGKTLLIQSLVKHCTKHSLTEIRGPITVVSGKQRRLQFVECANDINAMIDAAKFADLVLLLMDGSYGFEMETFEFLNILQVHGFPN